MLHFNFNGKIYREGTPVIGADNRGVRYGDGLFETIKMISGNLIAGDEHFARLWYGMQVLQFDIPKHFTPEVLQKEITAITLKNNHHQAARIRLSIFRGDGGLYDAKNHLPNYLIQSWPLAEDNGIWNSNGLVLGIYTAAKKSCDILSNLKHNNYLPYVLAALEAKKQKWNDAVLLNSNGNICDTTIANIFVVKNNIIYTPPLTDGCVAGIVRKQLIPVIAANGFEIMQQSLSEADLLQADEVFLTNSMYNIRWVKQFGDAMFGNLLTQKIYAVAHSTFQ